MTKEEKNLLIQDLSARLPYGVWIEHTSGFRGKLNNLKVIHKYFNTNDVQEVDAWIDFFNDDEWINVEYFKPILRPRSSVGEKEWKDINQITNAAGILSSAHLMIPIYGEVIEYFNKNDIDWRNLIYNGLAIEKEEDEE